ncbi:hypothetical protein MPH_05906 [Macrophomina phaseolina MS6]|uniref:Uncharacterized protein n=1 Tax=Macrophomina phaseolina (strain MS6) TaxID=1126212 RepID=K2SJD2_MACPH|nr:hypothetical protein MPH_05906 [Macrophomina phaseolina MS6]
MSICAATGGQVARIIFSPLPKTRATGKFLRNPSLPTRGKNSCHTNKSQKLYRSHAAANLLCRANAFKCYRKRSMSTSDGGSCTRRSRIACPDVCGNISTSISGSGNHSSVPRSTSATATFMGSVSVERLSTRITMGRRRRLTSSMG